MFFIMQALDKPVLTKCLLDIIYNIIYIYNFANFKEATKMKTVDSVDRADRGSYITPDSAVHPPDSICIRLEKQLHLEAYVKHILFVTLSMLSITNSITDH